MVVATRDSNCVKVGALHASTNSNSVYVVSTRVLELYRIEFPHSKASLAKEAQQNMDKEMIHILAAFGNNKIVSQDH